MKAHLKTIKNNMNKEFNKEEYNKMCAEVLGWEFQHGYYNPDHLHEYSFKTDKSLKFHSDWNWIMEVVENIENLYGGAVQFEISDESCLVAMPSVFSEYYVMDTKKDAVVQAIWGFLNWYKENKE